jgi:hypothetical protein
MAGNRTDVSHELEVAKSGWDLRADFDWQTDLGHHIIVIDTISHAGRRCSSGGCGGCSGGG